MTNKDKMKVTIQFNSKRITFTDEGETALSTYQQVLDVFKNPNEVGKNIINEEKTEITDYA